MRKGESKTVFSLQTKKRSQLPVKDFFPVDYGLPHQAFGFEIGPVCFRQHQMKVVQEQFILLYKMKKNTTLYRFKCDSSYTRQELFVTLFVFIITFTSNSPTQVEYFSPSIYVICCEITTSRFKDKIMIFYICIHYNNIHVGP